MTITSPRDLERWMDDRSATFAARSIRTVFGRGVRMVRTDPAPSAWISFASTVGSGRIVRDDDGTCHLSARRHADGHVLLDRSSPVTSTVELDALVDVLTPVETIGR